MKKKSGVTVLAATLFVFLVVFGSGRLVVADVVPQEKAVVADSSLSTGNIGPFVVPSHDGLPTMENFDGSDPMVLRSRQSGQLVQAGMKVLSLGDIAQARQLFWQALSLAPNNSLAYSFLAQIYFQEGQDDQALRMLEQAGRYSTYGDMVYGFLGNAILKWRAAADAPMPERVYLARFKDNKKAAICFTFDDGPKTVHSLLLPIFDRFGYKATIFVNPANTQDSPEAVWGSWSEWKDALARGHEIGSHSLHHWDLTILPTDVRENEIRQSVQEIKDKLGVTPESFAFPFDRADAASVAAVSRSFGAIRELGVLSGIQPKVFVPVYGGDKFSDVVGRSLVDLAVVKRLWMVAECHAAKTEEIMTFKPLTTDFMEKHLAYISSLGDQVWVDTFGRQFAYVSAVHRAKFNVLKERRREVVFSLELPSGEKGAFPLTVVINPAPEVPGKVTARAGRSHSQPSVRVEGSLIYVDVVPGSGSVVVRW